MSLFRSTAWWYARYRPRYPDALIRALAERAQIAGKRVLDLGTGTGQVAVPLAAFAAEVVAVDPEREMLDELDAPPNVRAVEARAEEVDGGWGFFALVTIGNAFHWMDHGILERLPTDQVALLGISTEEQATARELAEEMLGPRPALKQPDVRYEDELAASPFADVVELRVPYERRWTVDELVGLAYSTSYANQARLGERREEFERELRARLRETTVRGEAYALLGRRRDA